MNKTTQKILILITDLFFICFAWVAYYFLRIKTGWFEFQIEPELFLPMIAMYVYWLIIFTFFGMYRTWFASSRFDEISTLFKTTFVGIFILFFLIFISDFLEGSESGYRILIFIYWFFLFFFVAVGRQALRSFQRNLLIKGIGRRGTVIVGYNEKAKEVHDQILEHPALGLDIVGYVAINSDNIGKNYKNIQVLGSRENLLEIVRQTSASEIIIALEKEDHDLLVDIISKVEIFKVENKGIGLKIVPDLMKS